MAGNPRDRTAPPTFVGLRCGKELCEARCEDDSRKRRQKTATPQCRIKGRGNKRPRRTKEGSTNGGVDAQTGQDRSSPSILKSLCRTGKITYATYPWPSCVRPPSRGLGARGQ